MQYNSTTIILRSIPISSDVLVLVVMMIIMMQLRFKVLLGVNHLGYLNTWI